MVMDTTTPRSRRMVLTAGAGAIAAAVASALGRPVSVDAANGDTVTVGGTFTGTSPTNITNSGGDGIQGINSSTSASGLYGLASSASGSTYGVFGRSNSTTGVGVEGFAAAASGNTVGVRGVSGSGWDLAAHGTGRLIQKTTATVGAPTSGAYTAGEQIRDLVGSMWLCTASGSPGIWQQVRLQPALPKYPAGTVTRLSGADRFSTAAAISAATFATGVPVAYIANAYNFPDALAGAAAAGMIPGPVLLSGTNLPLNLSTATELFRLKPKRIVVLGGTGVISDAVKNALAAYAVGG